MTRDKNIQFRESQKKTKQQKLTSAAKLHNKVIMIFVVYSLGISNHIVN